MPGRTYASGGTKYRYGMNGQELEDEVFEGATSAEYWMYDGRLGRRFENDPITYEEQSPYVCFNDNPILFADPDGLEGTNGNGGKKTVKKEKNKKPEPKEKKRNKGKIDYGKLFHGKIINWLSFNLKRIFNASFREKVSKWLDNGEDIVVRHKKEASSLYFGGDYNEKHIGDNKHIQFDYSLGHPIKINIGGWISRKLSSINLHVNLKNPFHGWGLTFSISHFTNWSIGIGNWKDYNILGLRRKNPYSIGQIAKAHPEFSNPLIKITWINRHGHMNFIRIGKALKSKGPIINVFLKRRR